MNRNDTEQGTNNNGHQSAPLRSARWEDLDSGIYSPEAVRAEFLNYMFTDSAEGAEAKARALSAERKRDG